MSSQPNSNNASSSAANTAPDNTDSNNGDYGQRLRSGLYAPNVTGGTLPDDTIAGIVARLMNPPSPLYNNNQTVTLTINWAVVVVGPERFERLAGDNRYVLSYRDDLREQGEAAGLSSEILEWLEGGGETLTLPASQFE